MTAADSNLGRRGFLRALAAVPLLGGGLKLLGEPTAAAVPVSADLLRRYLLFLGKEQARVELELVRSPWHFQQMGYALTDQATWKAGAW